MSIPNNFTPMPDHGLTTSTPYTYTTARTFVEYVEWMRKVLNEITEVVNNNVGRVDGLVDEANETLTSAFRTIALLTQGYQTQLDEMEAHLATMRKTNDETQALLDSMPEKVDKDRLWVDVKDHGAVGDGVHDDTAAIAAAVALAGEGGTVFFPVGVYKVTSTLSMPMGSQWVSAARNHVVQVPAKSGAVIKWSGTGICVRLGVGASLVNLRISADARKVVGSVGIHAEKCSGFMLQGVFVDGFDTGIYVREAWYGHFNDVHVWDCLLCTHLDYCYNFEIRGSRLSGDGTSTCLKLSNSSQVNLTDSSIEGYTVGIDLGYASVLRASGTYFESNNGPMDATIGIEMRDCQHGVLDIHGSFVYLTNHRSWINLGGANCSATVNSWGNFFKGGNDANTMIYRLAVPYNPYFRFNIHDDKTSLVSSPVWRYCPDTPLIEKGQVLAPPRASNVPEVVYDGRPIYREGAARLQRVDALPGIVGVPAGAMLYYTATKRVVVSTGTAWVNMDGTPA